MMLRWTSHSPEETADIAGLILESCKNRKIFAIFGDLGAGKTTLVRSMCRIWGCTDKVTSPTFSIVNEYASPQGPVYHFDCYRLRNPEELSAMGFEEYLDSGRPVLIEWPETALEFLPADTVRVELQHTAPGTREIIITSE